MRRTLLVVLGLLAVASVASAQSLGEVAKKAEAARAKRTQPIEKKTYTDKDLKAVEPPAPLAVKPVAADAKPPALETSEPVRGELYWKDRMRDLVARLTEDTLALDAATTRLTEYSAAVERSRVDVDGFALVSRSLQSQALFARNEVSRLQATVKADTLAVDRLVEEARRASVPPGWLR